MTEEPSPGLLGPEASAALEDFIRAGATLVDKLRDGHGDQLGELLDDPVATIIGIGRKLGVECRGRRRRCRC